MWVAAEWPPRTPAARLSVSFRTRVIVSKTSHSVQNLSAECGEFFNRLLVARLVQPLMLPGSFKFGITGPPGVYSVLGSTNLATWSAVGVATNPLGSVLFHDVTTNVLPQKFYRALLQVPPANMVFIPPNNLRGPVAPPR